MTISVKTKVENMGMIDPPLGCATMEWGYGLYVNAYVSDTSYEIPGVENSRGCGLYATERVPFNCDPVIISRARKRARDRARRRYIREKEES